MSVEAARYGSLALTLLGVCAVGLAAWPYTVDDAYIVARYATHLAQGLGYGMNPRQSSDGVTGPLWVVPGTLAVALGGSPVAAAKLAGLACALVACIAVVRNASRRALGAKAAIATACMLVSLPDLATWGVSGLETGAAALAATVLGLCVLSRNPERFVRAGAASATLAWLRPELAPFVIVCLLAISLRARERRTAMWAVALLGAASVTLFRLIMFGDLVPLSAHAKPTSLANGAQYALTALVLCSSIIGCALAWWGARSSFALRAVGLALLVHVFAVALAGGDWMPGARLLVPVLPLFGLLVGRGVALVSLKRPWLAAALLVLAMSVPALDLVTRLPELASSGASRESTGRELAALLRAHARTVALLDVGFLGYASGIEIVDLGGLTDEVIAKAPGGHIDKRVEQAYLRLRAPDALVLHSSSAPEVDAERRLVRFAGYPVEHRVAAMPLFAALRVARVVKYAPGYYYVVLM